MVECTKKQVHNFNKEIDGHRNEFKKKMCDHREALAKSIKTIKSVTTNTDNKLSKKIDVVIEVVGEAVGMAKEIAVATAGKLVSDFTTDHLNGYISKLLPDLLKAEDIASLANINVVHEFLEKTDDAHKFFVAKVTQLPLS